MADGFMQSAAGLANLQQQSVNLRAAVDGGQLFINPDSAQKAAQACHDYANQLRRFARRAQQLARRQNFGDCAEGNALSAKFANKAQGGPNSAWDVLNKAAQIVENLASTYEDAGRAYQQAEETNSQSFSGKA
ncbi:hypothetical protein [Gandjariella thermophila]|uniref:ESX-1 secretion-associated protein n=1 Tax=Gandjariella thermophila TaxID=1931992 RepID=A0A4D4JB10_9PSEU|nr:hypothetical protein [Gandjariella thermophila]GDY32200.1 hypothetical protein GTS_38330 [Gandjariella thermophila]